jgi:hypothetical protein
VPEADLKGVLSAIGHATFLCNRRRADWLLRRVIASRVLSGALCPPDYIIALRNATVIFLHFPSFSLRDARDDGLTGWALVGR